MRLRKTRSTRDRSVTQLASMSSDEISYLTANGSCLIFINLFIFTHHVTAGVHINRTTHIHTSSQGSLRCEAHPLSHLLRPLRSGKRSSSSELRTRTKEATE